MTTNTLPDDASCHLFASRSGPDLWASNISLDLTAVEARAEARRLIEARAVRYILVRDLAAPTVGYTWTPSRGWKTETFLGYA